MAGQLRSSPAAVAGPPPPALDDGAGGGGGEEGWDGDVVEKARALICALNLVSRNLPLPPELFSAVSSIHSRDEGAEDAGDEDIVSACSLSPILLSFFLFPVELCLLTEMFLLLFSFTCLLSCILTPYRCGFI